MQEHSSIRQEQARRATEEQIQAQRRQSAEVNTKAKDYLSKLQPDSPFSEFEYILQEMGLEKGWGDTADRVLEMMQLLSNILQAPDKP